MRESDIEDMTSAVDTNGKIQNIGLGILCWKSYDCLTAQLDTHKKNGFLELFDEKIVYFQEIDDEGRELANQYGLQAKGRIDNQGIYGGFRGMAESMSSEYVLLLENDHQITKGQESAIKQLNDGLKILKENKAVVVGYECVSQTHSRKAKNLYNRFYPDESANIIKKTIGKIMRTIKAKKAKIMMTRAPYNIMQPENKLAQYKRDKETNFLLISSRHRTWSNRAFLINKNFFINTILQQVEDSHIQRLINGYKDIQAQLNHSEWWKSQDYTIGIADPGMFTHLRIGDRGH